MPANLSSVPCLLDSPLSHILKLVWGNRDSINTSVFMNSLKDLLVSLQALQHILLDVQQMNTEKTNTKINKEKNNHLSVDNKQHNFKHYLSI